MPAQVGWEEAGKRGRGSGHMALRRLRAGRMKMAAGMRKGRWWWWEKEGAALGAGRLRQAATRPARVATCSTRVEVSGLRQKQQGGGAVLVAEVVVAGGVVVLEVMLHERQTPEVAR